MKIIHSKINIILISILLTHLSSCSITNKYSLLVKNNNLTKKIFISDEFKSITLFNSLYYSNDKSTLYVFIEGDGIPWKTRSTISNNPNPKKPLALELMIINNSPSIYLSRPCYWVEKSNCHYQWWTNKRYSKQVVNHMLNVLLKIAIEYKHITLVGYSGGGTLAALISRSLKKPATLITLSGNMNHEKWTIYHGYSPLTGSLNPVNYHLPKNINQFHFAGDNDNNILPEWIEEYSDSQVNSHYFLMKNTDHNCCWVERWSQILKIVKN